MTSLQVYALGNFLSTYSSDLTYISNFQQIKQEGFIKKQNWEKNEGSFKSFLDEYRVTRNINSTKRFRFWEITCAWVSGKECDNVDGYANQLNLEGLTHKKIMTSLASKVLFLNNPWHILPMDKWVKDGVSYKGNIYGEYLPLANHFAFDSKEEIAACLNSVSHLTEVIELNFNDNLEDLKTIRTNRFVDKLLWAKGIRKDRISTHIA